MTYEGISILHELIHSCLHITGCDQQLFHINRCAELMLMDSQFKKRCVRIDF